MKNNKVCIVTGASRGLGRGIALVLAQEEGCTCMLLHEMKRQREMIRAGDQSFLGITPPAPSPL